MVLQSTYNVTLHATLLRRPPAEHPVTLVVGATGSGKSAQFPKIRLAAGRGAGAMIGHARTRRPGSSPGPVGPGAGAPPKSMSQSRHIHDRWLSRAADITLGEGRNGSAESSAPGLPAFEGASLFPIPSAPENQT